MLLRGLEGCFERDFITEFLCSSNHMHNLTVQTISIFYITRISSELLTDHSLLIPCNVNPQFDKY